MCSGSCSRLRGGRTARAGTPCRTNSPPPPPPCGASRVPPPLDGRGGPQNACQPAGLPCQPCHDPLALQGQACLREDDYVGFPSGHRCPVGFPCRQHKHKGICGISQRAHSYCLTPQRDPLGVASQCLKAQLPLVQCHLCCFPSNSSCTPYFVLFIAMPCSIQNFINYNRAFRRRFCLFCCSGRTADLLPLL